MCGVSGLISKNKNLDIGGKAQKMLTPLTHRGPDMSGSWTSDCKTLSLNHNRLSIIDLSENGKQPMTSNSGRYVITFNGEIYNYQALRLKLENNNYRFKGNTDTETILAALEIWGINEALTALNGMFAFAVYDKKQNLLHLARDRIGKKPLYYGHDSNGFYFASEIKAILPALNKKPALNRDVAALYFQWRYVPDPYCIFEGFQKLPPGHMLTVNIGTPNKTEIKAYWSLTDITNAPPSFNGSKENAENALNALLKNATEKRLMTDVPLGAFLSGGVDSSLIVAMMQQHQKTSTFTIAFEDKKYNEATYARQIADYLGTEHTEVTVKANEALDTINILPKIFDEPFADPSAIPTYHVCRLARQNMTVALSGDGGDESFGGYSWYERARKLRALPLRNLAGTLLSARPLSPQIRKIASILKAGSPQEQYAALHSYWQTENLLNFVPSPLPLPIDKMNGGLMAYDSTMFLPGDVLTKVDRVSMAVSLEVRSPLLDKNIIEFAWTLPLHIRRQKSLLKSLLGRYLPEHLINRPKQGFSIPHQEWLRGPLKDWAHEMIKQDNELLNMAKTRKIWDEHQSGNKDYGHLLWTILMYQSWHKEWM